MLPASTSNTSRVLSGRGVAEDGWPCASVLVWGDFIQVHTSWPGAFSQQGAVASALDVSVLAWLESDDAHTQQRHGNTCDIPTRRPDAVDGP